LNELLVGIFVGGSGRRLGGVSKGLLPAPGGATTLIERLLGELHVAVPEAPIVLVGRAEAYGALGLPTLADHPPGVGPLGGVISLLEDAERRRARSILALTCDLPMIGSALLGRLASEAPHAAALVTAQQGVRNPLVARYAVAEALPAARGALRGGFRSVQAVLEALNDGVVTLAQTAEEESSLADWDEPSDLR
jgi:molybdopterin-guanine dinucleotide biosynthesis protein A